MSYLLCRMLVRKCWFLYLYPRSNVQRNSDVSLVPSHRTARRLIVGSWAIAVSGQLRQGSKQFALSVAGHGARRTRSEKEGRCLGIARCAVTSAFSTRRCMHPPRNASRACMPALCALAHVSTAEKRLRLIEFALPDEKTLAERRGCLETRQ